MADLRQLTKQDVLFVAGETANVYQHTAGLVLLDTSQRPDFNFDSFREHVIERVKRIPHFHWKLHEVPMGLDLPYWVEDENFSYSHHIRRIGLPSPGDREVLGEVVSYLYSKHLDRTRPLWEMWLIEGLEGGRYAVLQKLHHCMMDGEGAAKLAEIMCDLEPDAKPRKVESAISSARAGKAPSQRRQLSNTATHLALFPSRATREIAEFVTPMLKKRMRRRGKSEDGKREVPQASFNADITCDRGFVFGSVSLTDIKRVKAHFDVSVNDVVLALVGGSLRSFLQQQGNLPDESLCTSIPVSLRTEEDDEFSNRVTNTSVTLATDVEDPVERLSRIHSETGEAKKVSRSGAKSMVDVMQILPPLLVNAMIASTPTDAAAQMLGANLIVSNVRGSPRAMYIAGARMETSYPMSILTPGMGINVTCVSYVDQVDFGIAIAPELVPDPWLLIDGLDAALAEYVALVGKKRTPRKKAATKKGASARKTATPKKKPAPRKKAVAKKKTPAKKKSPAGRK